METGPEEHLEEEEEEEEGPDAEEVNVQLGASLLWLQHAAALLCMRARQRALQAAVVLCTLLLLLWTAVFLYGSFYYYFMPTAHFSTPVYFYYRTDCDSPLYSICSFPVANVSLLRNGRDQVMSYGQPYQISLELVMPESPANQQLGMFMVKMSCYTSEGRTINTAARSTMLHYRSAMLQSLATLLFSPFLLLGASEQTQHVLMELFSSYTDNSYLPTAGAVIEVQSQKVQIYAAHLYIHAHFTGIRYILFTFPATSAVVGVASNMAFLLVLVLLSYLQPIWSATWPPAQVRDWTRFGGRMEEFSTDADKSENTLHVPDNSTDVEANDDFMDSNYDEMEESIPKIGVEEMKMREHKSEEEEEEGEEEEEEFILTAEMEEIDLKHRAMSEGAVSPPPPPTASSPTPPPTVSPPPRVVSCLTS